ncbi:MAG: alpha/beta fold hydrolase [Candidatus Dormibacteria bacterium]
MQSFFVDAGGPVFVADYGGSGPVIVLLHGLGGSHLNWMSVAPGLARNHRVLAPDLPGFGRTPSEDRGASVAANVRLLERVIRQVSDDRVVLVGNSMGGMISLGLAARSPQLLSGLVLVDPALPAARGERIRLDPVALRFMAAYALPRFGEYLFSATAKRLGADVLVKSTLELCTVHMQRIDGALVDAMVALERERMEQPRWHRAVVHGSRSIVKLLLSRARIEGWIRQITVPMLLIHGVQDEVVKVRAARAAADLRPDWEYVEFESCGHVPMMEHPQRFLAVLTDWLRRTAPSELSGTAVVEETLSA